MASLQEKQSLPEKYREVNAWLKNIVPDYDFNHEISSSQIETLLKIKRCNEEKDVACRAAIEDLKEKTEEYEAKSKNISALLSGLLLSPKKFDSQTSEALSSLANLSVTLGIQSSGSETSYHLELFNLLESLEMITEQREDIVSSIAATNAKTIASTVQLSKIERISQDVNKEVKSLRHQIPAKEKNCEFLQQKADDYVKRAKKLMIELSNNGYTTSYSHERLLAKHQEFLALQKQVATLKVKVDSYHDLPSNVPLASIKLTEAKEELRGIKEELRAHIDA